LLLLQVLEDGNGVNDRFYCSLYRKLLDPTLESSSHNHPMFFHVLYKTLKSDNVENRVSAFLKRLLQISLYSEPTFACSVLMLLSEVVKEKTGLLKLKKKALNTDLTADDDDDEEEHYVDVHSVESDHENSDGENPIAKMKSSWMHKENISTKSRKKFDYDPTHRNPMFANAQLSLLYELHALRNHYHPSVAFFVKKVIQNEPIEYSGDPLQDFTTMRFLDRFAYRNPKLIKEQSGAVEEGAEELEPEPTKKLPKRTSYRPWGAKMLAVTSDEYAQTPLEAVPIDEQFLHKFITSYGITQPTCEGNDDNCSVNSEEFEEIMSKKRIKKLKR